MTAAELEAIGRRAVACEGWRWLDGCKLVTSKSDAFRVFLTWDDETYTLWTAADGEIVSDEGRGATSDYLRECLDIGFPDLSDPATIGCVWALLNEQAGWHWVAPSDGAWVVFRWMGGQEPKVEVDRGRNKAEALVAALEAAGQGGEL